MTREHDSADRIKSIFLDAIEIDPADRGEFLKDACGADDALRARVESLLANDEANCEDPLMGSPIAKSIGEEFFSAQSGDTLIGRRVGRYEIKSHIGAGGMGDVYLAVRVDQYQQQVAIKLVRQGLGNDESLRRFQNETQFLANLGKNANIATLLDAGTTEEGWPYLVMEYIEGRSIDVYCDERELTIAERLKLFQQVCSAVQFAHQRTLIHRDLKPANILVTEEGVAKLIDFGIAKLIDKSATPLIEQTQTIQRALTPYYASPEQVRNEALATTSDVYSLGVVLYELLTGQRPYRLTSQSASEIERRVCEQDPVRPSSALLNDTRTLDSDEQTSDMIDKGVPPDRRQKPSVVQRQLAGDIDNIVMMALRKEPTLRYQSVINLSEDIQRHLDGRPVRARPATWRYRTGKFVRRNKVLVAAAALILVSVLGGIFGTTSQWLKARKESNAAHMANESLTKIEELQKQQLYVAHMNLVQQAWDAGNAGRAVELLSRYSTPSPGEDLRGFEWFYWMRKCHQDVASFESEESPTCVSFSPAGRLIVSGSQQGSIQLWDYARGASVAVLKGHTDRVNSLAFSHDGKILASTSNDTTVRLWDMEKLELAITLEGHRWWANGVAFTPGSQRLVSVAGKWNARGEFIVWNWTNGEVEQRIPTTEHSDYLRCMASSPDGETVATSGWDGQVILWNASLEKERNILIGRSSTAHALAFSSDGSKLAMACEDHILRLWDLVTDDLVAFKGHTGAINCLAFLPDNRLASGSSDNMVKIWNTGTGELQATIKGHAGQVTGVAVAPDASTLVSSSLDKTVKCWDLGALETDDVLPGHTSAIYALAFSPDGATLASGDSGRSVRIWDVAKQKCIHTLESGFTRVTAIKYSPDGRTMVTGGRGSKEIVKLWNVEKKEGQPDGIPRSSRSWQVTEFEASSSVEGVDISSDGRFLAVRPWITYFQDLSLWSVLPHKRIARLQGDPDLVTSVAFSPQGRYVTTGSSETFIPRLWEVATGRCLVELRGHEAPVAVVMYSPDGELLATGSQDSTIRIWHGVTGEHQLSLVGHSDHIRSLAFSPDSKTLASGSNDTTIRLWNLNIGEQKTTLRGHTRTVTAVEFSPDGKTLASASEDRTIRLWRTLNDQTAR